MIIGRGLGSRTQFTSRIKPAMGPEVYLRRGQGAGHQSLSKMAALEKDYKVQKRYFYEATKADLDFACGYTL